MPTKKTHKHEFTNKLLPGQLSLSFPGFHLKFMEMAKQTVEGRTGVFL